MSTVSTSVGGPVAAKPEPIDARLMRMPMGRLLATVGASRPQGRR